MSDVRFIEYPSCNGDGGFETIHGYDPRDGQPVGFWMPCPDCQGKHEVEVKTQPVTLEDLDDLFECDCCGKMKPKDEIARCWPSGTETFACEQCRGG